MNQHVSTNPLVTLAELKLFLRADEEQSTEDSLITSLGEAATAAAESYCSTQFTTQVWQYAGTAVAGEAIELESPVKAITSVTVDDVEVDYELDDNELTVDVDGEIEINYTTGPATVSPQVIAGIKSYANHLYSHRDEPLDGLPALVEAMWWPHAVLSV